MTAANWVEPLRWAASGLGFDPWRRCSLNNLEPYNRVVSSDDEQLILVDSADREIGFLARRRWIGLTTMP